MDGKHFLEAGGCVGSASCCGVTPKRYVFIHEAGARETSAEAFPSGRASGVPGKLSPEINPSSVIGSMIKLLSLCISPDITPKSLPPQLHAPLCQKQAPGELPS